MERLDEQTAYCEGCGSCLPVSALSKPPEMTLLDYRDAKLCVGCQVYLVQWEAEATRFRTAQRTTRWVTRALWAVLFGAVLLGALRILLSS